MNKLKVFFKIVLVRQLCSKTFINMTYLLFQSDIVYTFFHPLLRDEQEAQKENLGIQKFRGTGIKLT